MSQQGQLQQLDFFDNKEGLNLVDSPFKVRDGQSVFSQNITYPLMGGFRKRQGHAKVNSVADSQTDTLGLGLFNTTAGVKTVIRGAGTKLQNFDVSTPLFTNLSEDTLAAGTDFLSGTSTLPVVWSQFNTSNASGLWAAAGGLSSVYGVYSTTKVTKNGADAPTGSISTSVTTPGTGTFSTTGTFFYAIALRKASTQAVSLAALDKSATVAATTDNVVISLASLASVDTTKYDAIYLYRSAVSGVTAFTTGDLVSITSITSGVPASITDTGSSSLSTQNIPRAGGTVDNSVLPSGTYNSIATFKRRLVTATGSTLYLSDLNKPESWPTANTITIPSGGPITGLAVLSFTSTGSNTIDEILCIYKDTELWVLTGTSASDWVLKFIDNTGCVNQSLVVNANGYLFWVALDDVYLWNGTGKPVRCGRLIKPLFYSDGDIDKAKLSYGHGVYYKKQDQVIWFLSHKVYGEQKMQLKLDLKTTLPGIESGLSGGQIDGVFLIDSTAFGLYASLSYFPTGFSESLLMGDDTGFCYGAFTAESDAAAAFSMKYQSRYVDCGDPNKDKRFHYVVVWVEEIGTWNITLDWWTDYKSADSGKSSKALPIAEKSANLAALWDVAYWDQAYWDDYTPKYKPIFFQLVSDSLNNSEGKCIKLQFRQDDADAPVTVLGFSLIFSEKAMNTRVA